MGGRHQPVAGADSGTADRPATGPEPRQRGDCIHGVSADRDCSRCGEGRTRATGEDAAPRTEAGRKLLDDIGYYAFLDGSHLRDRILAIEAEAAQRAAAPPHEHEKQVAAWLDGYRSGAAQGAAAPPDLLREAIEAEWYNGNMSEDAMDRLLARLSGASTDPTEERT